MLALLIMLPEPCRVMIGHDQANVENAVVASVLPGSLSHFPWHCFRQGPSAPLLQLFP